ncbi:uncharacterized protein SPAPADRAFT_152650 [Spathaspora passalidarum NRRL Y-27907]|uniref:Zn(2)-C6 fungal-type domain-containing protein n=1 Tax=Spathaspora passalidarum (strain NRRL Y-27907 / 11-Y1) TaxID=619300 RepID=G3APH2_SPAPN|nr:uncharacterized protein SPAPADRAFT_152650 [Spathaspora passalidarum NRRL Y-27907]EGW32143.1 hypothetical protein SPAPADRAFT_152650 [Spathaspora passalidarum NRRL Y-27907]
MSNGNSSGPRPGTNSLGNLVNVATSISQELHLIDSQQIKSERQQHQPSPTPSNHNSSHNGPVPPLTSSLSPPLANSPASQKAGKPKRMACVECRQQKSRCDASERHPEPCTRCFKKGLKCDLKSDYKRTYKRARIAQIEREFSELKKTLNSTQAAELLNKVPSLANITSPQEFVSSPQSRTIIPNPSAIRHSQVWNNNINNNLHNPEQPHSALARPPIATPYDRPHHVSSSETNYSIPNTPSIARPVPEPTGYQGPVNRELQITMSEAAMKCEEKSVDSITLSPETIKALFLEYVERYHPIVPIVDVEMGPERIYRICPALFWVIMFVSLRRFYEDTSLLVQLSPIVKGILAEIMISPITRYNPFEEDEPTLNVSSVYSVQAFLLYSYWPPITSSLSADSSYSTVSTAFFQAIRIGLHSPVSMSDTNINSRTPQQLTMAKEQAKTWIVSNIASQTIATAFGFPACVQFDSSVWSYSRPDRGIKIPQAIQFMMEIAYFEDQMAKSLNSNPLDTYGLIDPTERLPLLKLLTKRLDELEIKMSHELPYEDAFRKFQLLSTRVHLLTYYFMDSSRIADFELQKGLVKLYNAAIALINHTRAYQAKDKKFIKYLPGVYILNVWQAACIIGKLIHSRLKSLVDTGSGKQSYEAAIALMAKASILKHDMAYRASAITRNMWQLFRTLDEKKMSSLSIDIRNRMSASVFFDCLYLLRTQVGMTKLNRDSNNIAEQIDHEQEEAVVSYDEDENSSGESSASEEAVEAEEKNEGNPSAKSTPGSTTSSSRIRKARSLSHTVDAESKARKIIMTIPLDPQPISVSGGKRSSIFKVVNSSNDSSPHVNNSSEKSSPNVTRQAESPNNSRLSSSNNNKPAPPSSWKPVENKEEVPVLPKQTQKQPQQYPQQQQQQQQQQQYVQDYQPQQQFSDMVFNESPIQLGLENLEMDTFDHDMLWKDVDSVMNDFGFPTS